jgi:spectinomycin phosphotransferase
VAEALRDAFGIQASGIELVEGGYDAGAWVARADAYLLKIREAGHAPRGLLVPRRLHERGLPHVVPPLATRSGALCAEVAGYALAVRPFVEGRTGASEALSPAQWRELGAFARRVHDVPVTDELRAVCVRETFVPGGRESLEALRLTRDVAEVWDAHADAIRDVVARADALGPRLARARLPEVLCHADLHTWNVLVDTHGRIRVVDWDEAAVAPRERDLMFAVGGGISRRLVAPTDTDAFLAGYGDAAAPPLALAYYRAAWAVQDVVAYAHQGRPAELARLFEPGEIVEIALAEEV